jgi:hypothetical protein
MLAHSAQGSPSRRRLLVGLTALGVAGIVTGCDRAIPLLQASPTSAPRPPARTPLAPAGPPAAPRTLVGVVFGRVLMLEGVSVERDTVEAGDDVRVWLHWQSVAPTQEDLRSIGRVVSPHGRIIASEDDQIGGRRYHLSRWQAGERRVDEMRVRVTASSAPGEYALAIGVLRPDNLTAVPITARSAMVAAWQEDAVLVRTIEVVSG